MMIYSMMVTDSIPRCRQATLSDFRSTRLFDAFKVLIYIRFPKDRRFHYVTFETVTNDRLIYLSLPIPIKYFGASQIMTNHELYYHKIENVFNDLRFFFLLVYLGNFSSKST